MIYKFLITVFCFLYSVVVDCQELLDSCFLSGSAGKDFFQGNGIVNTGEKSADMLIWKNGSWTGGWPFANITAPLPPEKSGCDCRAVWIGNGTSWTTNGEGFAIRLITELITGAEYSFDFSYISTGFGSDGAFSPYIYSTDNIQNHDKYFIDTLPNVGYVWETNTLTFIADTLQHGHNWINIQTETEEGSGIVSAFCSECPCRGFIEMPNVFTPNGDRINDIFKAIVFKDVNSFNFSVYNRWGKLLHEDETGIPDWNGKIDFEFASDGIYYWVLEYQDFKEIDYVLSGFLNLTK